jgi:hypothetical protein
VRVAVYSNPWEPSREDWALQRVTVERPHSFAGWTSPGAILPLATTVNMGTTVMNNLLTKTSVLPGFTIKFAVVHTALTGNSAFNPTIALSGAFGGVATILNTGTVPDVVQLIVYYDINGDNLYTPGEPVASLSNIRLGLETPLALIGTATSQTDIVLSWNPVPGAANYRVEMLVNGVWQVLTTTAGTSYTVTGLLANTPYQFRVFAVNGAVESTPAGPLTVTTLP